MRLAGAASSIRAKVVGDARARERVRRGAERSVPGLPTAVFAKLSSR